jgi:RimJ/RimL family protein N-acetyltransferase
MSLRLWPCDAAARPLPTLPASPWTRYLAWADGRLVGGGGFSGPPRAGTVEIGYFTLPEARRLGHGHAIAAALLALARQADGRLRVLAHTARVPGTIGDDGASARILRALGFACSGAVHDTEAGPAWRWQAPPARQRPAPEAPGDAAPTIAR